MVPHLVSLITVPKIFSVILKVVQSVPFNPFHATIQEIDSHKHLKRTTYALTCRRPKISIKEVKEEKRISISDIRAACAHGKQDDGEWLLQPYELGSSGKHQKQMMLPFAKVCHCRALPSISTKWYLRQLLHVPSFKTSTDEQEVVVHWVTSGPGVCLMLSS